MNYVAPVQPTAKLVMSSALELLAYFYLITDISKSFYFLFFCPLWPVMYSRQPHGF